MAIGTWEEPVGGFEPGAPQGGNGGSNLSTDQAKQMAGHAVDQAKEKAGQVAETAREVVKGQVETRTSQAGGQVSSIAADLRRAAESLRAEGSQGFVADLAERAAAGVEQAAGYLENADLEMLMDDFKRVGRQRPMAVAGGLFALGFAASRLIKASAETGEE